MIQKPPKTPTTLSSVHPCHGVQSVLRRKDRSDGAQQIKMRDHIRTVAHDWFRGCRVALDSVVNDYSSTIKERGSRVSICHIKCGQAPYPSLTIDGDGLYANDDCLYEDVVGGPADRNARASTRESLMLHIQDALDSAVKWQNLPSTTYFAWLLILLVLRLSIKTNRACPRT